MVAERLVLGGDDRPVLVRLHRTELDAVGKRRLRDVLEIGPAHEEEPADRLEPRGLDEAQVAGLVLVDHRLAHDGGVGRFFPATVARAAQVLVEYRATDPAPTLVRVHGAPGLERRRARPGSTAPSSPRRRSVRRARRRRHRSAGPSRPTLSRSSRRCSPVGIQSSPSAWLAAAATAAIPSNSVMSPARGRRNRSPAIGGAPASSSSVIVAVASVVVIERKPPGWVRRRATAWTSRRSWSRPRSRVIRIGSSPGWGSARRRRDRRSSSRGRGAGRANVR